jgi:hypothetical protein
MTEKLPNFFIIGAAKSGTTSLHEYLDQHPEIYMSFPKELNFFSFLDFAPDFSGPCAHWDNPVLADRLRRERYELSITTWSEYKKVFAHAGPAKAIGESSVSYLYFPQAAARIRQFTPDARLIAILRNPVDRAYSKYRQLRRDGAEPCASFEDAIAAEPARMRENWSPAWFYVDRGLYYRQLKRYYDLFDHHSLMVILFDEFTNDTKDVMQDIFAFLDIDSAFRVDLDEKHNASDDKLIPRNMYLYTLIARPSVLSRTARDFLPKRALAQIRPLVRKVLSKRIGEDDTQALTEEARKSLTEFFREDILRLQDLIQKDLTSWL